MPLLHFAGSTYLSTTTLPPTSLPPFDLAAAAKKKYFLPTTLPPALLPPRACCECTPWLVPRARFAVRKVSVCDKFGWYSGVLHIFVSVLVQYLRVQMTIASCLLLAANLLVSWSTSFEFVLWSRLVNLPLSNQCIYL